MTGLRDELHRQQTRVRESAQDADATETPAITGAQAGKRQFDRNLPATLPSQLDQRWNGVDVALVAQDLQDRLGQCGPAVFVKQRDAVRTWVAPHFPRMFGLEQSLRRALAKADDGKGVVHGKVGLVRLGIG